MVFLTTVKLLLLDVIYCCLFFSFTCAQQTTTTTTTTVNEGRAAADGGGPLRPQTKNNIDMIFLESRRNNDAIGSVSLGRFLTFSHDLWSVDDGSGTVAMSTSTTPLDIVGTSQGYCQVLDDMSTAQCVWTLTIIQPRRLGNDTEVNISKLMLYGDTTTTSLHDWSEQGDMPKVYTITGGTGDYEGTSGKVQVTTIDQSFRAYNVFLA